MISPGYSNTLAEHSQFSTTEQSCISLNIFLLPLSEHSQFWPLRRDFISLNIFLLPRPRECCFVKIKRMCWGFNVLTLAWQENTIQKPPTKIYILGDAKIFLYFCYVFMRFIWKLNFWQSRYGRITLKISPFVFSFYHSLNQRILKHNW